MTRRVFIITLFIIIIVSMVVKFCATSWRNSTLNAHHLEFKKLADANFRRQMQAAIRRYFLSFKWKFTQGFTEEVANCFLNCDNNTINVENGISYDENCQTNPVLISDREITEENLAIMTRSEASLPCIFTIEESQIPNIGRGVFAKYRIPAGFVFGPYVGEESIVEKIEDIVDNGYTVSVGMKQPSGEIIYVTTNGQDKNKSNWLRWVNSARWFEEQNGMLIFVSHYAYLVTFKDVEPNAEFLVWYHGSEQELNISTVKGSNHDWRSGFAPLKDIVICPTCQRTDVEDEEL